MKKDLREDIENKKGLSETNYYTYTQFFCFFPAWVRIRPEPVGSAAYLRKIVAPSSGGAYASRSRDPGRLQGGSSGSVRCAHDVILWRRLGQSSICPKRTRSCCRGSDFKRPTYSLLVPQPRGSRSAAWPQDPSPCDFYTSWMGACFRLWPNIPVGHAPVQGAPEPKPPRMRTGRQLPPS